MVDYLLDHAHKKAFNALKTHTGSMVMNLKKLKPRAARSSEGVN
jgi:hypothetical protein